MSEQLDLDQFHTYLRARGYDVPRESQVLLALFDLYQSGEWGELVQAEFASMWIWNEKAKRLLAPFAVIQREQPPTERYVLRNRISELEQQIAASEAHSQKLQEALDSSLAMQQEDEQVMAQARELLEELVKRDERFLLPYNDYADNFLEQIRAFLAAHPAPVGGLEEDEER